MHGGFWGESDFPFGTCDSLPIYKGDPETNFEHISLEKSLAVGSGAVMDEQVGGVEAAGPGLAGAEAQVQGLSAAPVSLWRSWPVGIPWPRGGAVGWSADWHDGVEVAGAAPVRGFIHGDGESCSGWKEGFAGGAEWRRSGG